MNKLFSGFFWAENEICTSASKSTVSDWENRVYTSILKYWRVYSHDQKLKKHILLKQKSVETYKELRKMYVLWAD